MNKDLTEILLVVDKSGSMSGMEKDTIGGINSFIEKQKELPGMARLTLCLFSNSNKLLYDGKDLKKVKELTDKDYSVGGGTALFDAVGESISSIVEKNNKLEKDAKEDSDLEKLIPANYIVVIVTDGEENSSTEYDKKTISNLIESKQSDGWSFVYLSAGADAFISAKQMGIDILSSKNLTRNYNNNPEEVAVLYCSISETVADARQGNDINSIDYVTTTNGSKSTKAKKGNK